MARYPLGILLTIVAFAPALADEEPVPPVAEKKPVKLERHGDVRIDEYFWLNERDNPDVIAYLEAENAYAEAALADISGLRQRLVDEMRKRLPGDMDTAPYPDGDYLYFERYEDGKEYPVYLRRLRAGNGDEEVLLDVNELAGDEAYFAVRNVSVSPDHSRLAYGVDTQGRRFYDIHVIDLEDRAEIDRIPAVTSNFEWSADSESLVYIRQEPDTLRWYQAYVRDLADGKSSLIYEEQDETFSLFADKALSGRFIYLTSASTLANEVRYLPAENPSATPSIMLPRAEDHEYFVTDGIDRFFILSNDGATNFQVLSAPVDDPGRENWTVVVPHREDTLIEGMTVFAGHLVLSGKRNGLDFIEIMDRDSGARWAVEFPEPLYALVGAENAVYDTEELRFGYESLTSPESVYVYDMASREMEKTWEKPVLGGFDSSDYQSERLFVEVRDGTRVPVSLVYRKGLELDGQNPLLQYGYGSYGSTIEPGFDSNLVSLLDRGFIFAIAHVRGGAEMGRDWYYQGRQRTKKNTFTDFIDVSRFLIEEGYTSPEHLYARGGSAGGLLMGAVANMAPELYNGITSRVPFVDVITTMLDESIPLTAGEWDEWGDPREKGDYEYMLSYSPYDQVSEQDYPNMLVTTGLHDSQVQYWEPAKWVARLRDRKTDDNLLLLYTDMQAGHSGKTGRFQSLEDDALYYAFFLMLEGIRE